MARINPFVADGYAGSEYFCDRVEETKLLNKWLINSNNVALMAPRRYGKTDLIRHCFAQKEIQDNYYTFIVDIYSAKSFEDIVRLMSASIIRQLKPISQKALDTFLSFLNSLRAGISFDLIGNPTFSIQPGELVSPEVTLNEIFQYLNNADKPCLVALDEFQQVGKIKDERVEATFRTYVQYCTNANFIFAGSERHMMGAMFTSPNKPFYQSATIYELGKLPMDKYVAFAENWFYKTGLEINSGVVEKVFQRFDGITYYIQRVMNELYANTEQGVACTMEDVDIAIQHIVAASSSVYENLLYQLPEKQSHVLKAICKDGLAQNLTSGDFVRRHKLQSPNSVKSAIPALLEKDLITCDKGAYAVYDKLLEIWLNNQI